MIQIGNIYEFLGNTITARKEKHEAKVNYLSFCGSFLERKRGKREKNKLKRGRVRRKERRKEEEEKKKEKEKGRKENERQRRKE